MASTETSPREVAVFYATDSLARQLTGWIRRHPGSVIKYAFTRQLPEARSVLDRAGAVMIDATEDVALAADVFSQGVSRLGVSATAVYTEKMHDGLELFVRSRGAMMVLGPLSEMEWEAFFETIGRNSGRGRASRRAA